MASKTLLSKLKIAKDTTANWQSNDPILLNGELGLELTTTGDIRIKTGDGSTSWNNLKYTYDYRTWIGDTNTYNSDKASGKITDSTICIITDDNISGIDNYVVSVNGKSGNVVLGLDDIASQTDYVKSINGKTGEATLTLSDIAQPTQYVLSVNGSTGSVTIDAFLKSGPELSYSSNTLTINGNLKVASNLSITSSTSYNSISNSGLGLELHCPNGYIRLYGNSTQELKYNDDIVLTSANYNEYSLPLTGGTLTGQLTAPTLRLTSTSDAGLSSTEHALQIGPTSGSNLVIDNNEIMSRSNGSASALSLNFDGGDVYIGGVDESIINLRGKLNLSHCEINTPNITYSASDNSSRHIITVVEPTSTTPTNTGVAVKLGGGQGTIIAGGECGYVALNDSDINIGDSEQLFLMADSNIRLFTNANVYANRHVWIMNAIPTFYIEGSSTTGKGNIGANGNRWASVHASTVYSNGSAVSTSDERLKKNINPLGNKMSSKDFIMALNPVEYKYKASIGTSGRKHYGFIAQEVKSIIESQDLGDLGIYTESPIDESKDLKDCTYDDVELGLRYEEFIAPIVKLLQEQQSTIDKLSDRLAYLEDKFSN